MARELGSMTQAEVTFYMSSMMQILASLMPDGVNGFTFIISTPTNVFHATTFERADSRKVFEHLLRTLPDGTAVQHSPGDGI